VKIIIFIVAITLTPSYVFAGWFGPSTYEECVLENIKEVKSDKAAELLAQVCRKKFPEKISPKLKSQGGISPKLNSQGGMPDEEFEKLMEDRRRK
jgi:hypothetical protein